MTSAENTATFSDLYREGARLIRSTEPPDLDTLSPGDMVICEEDWESEEYISSAAEAEVHVRVGPYRYEAEKVHKRRTRMALARDYPEPLGMTQAPPLEVFDSAAVEASRDAFARTWDALSAEVEQETPYEPAAGYVPDDWVSLLPYPTLNPAQVQAAPTITGDGNAFVVAATGAGKTVIGQMACLHEIKRRGGKAAWLVPQRALTGELDKGMEYWRSQGLKVMALSGEVATDLERARDADLWVATVEKFEALCRASSMRETIDQIGTLVVDEIHLLGDSSRGPLLEALLARIRGEDSPVRMVGLSATAANAEQVAQWLNAELVEITWRPTRLTQQMLTIPSDSRPQENRHRNAVATLITREVSMDEGSTLVFCGAKRNVRSTALAIATSRGAQTRGVDQDDVDAVYRACADVGVGLHYSDWPHRREAEALFRDREINVLVATSTLAAGVNTPARVVVVRDTSIGPQPMEVSMVQQMFGRAGRAGQEPEGWAYLVASADEVSTWRQRLATGYTIRSGILTRVGDHILGEIVQKNINTRKEMESWWEATLAYHQGERSLTSLNRALDFLERWRFIEVEEIGDGDQRLRATRLGALTSRMMVGVQDAADLIKAFREAPTPKGHMHAEAAVIYAVSHQVYDFANGSNIPGDQAPAVLRLIGVNGDVRAAQGPASRQGSNPRCTSAQAVQAGLLLAARSPWALRTQNRQIAGINRSVLLPALYDSPRYLAWLGALGPFGTVPGWASVVAADLGQRVKHHRLAPPRGSGRLLRSFPEGGGRAASSAWKTIQDSNCRRPEELPRAGRSKPSGLATIREGKTGSGVELYVPGSQGWVRAKGPGQANGLAAAFSKSGDWSGSGWLERFSVVMDG